MPVPWYERYFTSDYWAYADDEYNAARTAAEVDYLATVLRQHAPGRRVLDLGCGVGRHAVALAQRGFDVTGVDISDFALSRAGDAAREAGVELRTHRADVLMTSDWGVAEVDAVVCVQAFGWGSDADQLRLLRRAHRLLAPGGILVLDHSNILAIAARYQPLAQAEIGGAVFGFVRRYDPVTGRSNGEVRVQRADGSSTVLPDDVRMYQPAEVRALLSRAGFDLVAVDAEFTPGAPVDLNSRYVQFVARPRPAVTSALRGHRQPPSTGLDLRWAPDEAQFVTGGLAAAWADLQEQSQVLDDRLRRYDLTDPYGAGRATALLAAAVGWPGGGTPSPEQVSAGAGATGLLHALAALADGDVVLVDPVGHPQLSATAQAAGADVRVADLTDLSTAVAAIAEHRPAVTVLDRPGLRGSAWSIADVAALARATTAAGGILVVDETCATYLHPGDSVAGLTAAVAGLIVVRSMSKGYCAGGLRVGFAIASPDLAAVVRAALPPLAVSALSLDLALALLRQPDPLAPLRRRIAEAKPAVIAALTGVAISTQHTDPHVPWVLLPGTDEIRTTLADAGVSAKDVPVRHQDGHTSTVLRMAVPLSDVRRKAFCDALTGVAGIPARHGDTDAPR